MMRFRKWIFSSLLILVVVAVAGCQSIGYYKQAISGQMQMLSNQRPLSELIADSQTKPKLKEKFRLILSLRDFAEEKLGLSAGGRYLSYVDLHRSNAVWNVYAAPEFSLKPKAWWYPVVGNVTYRGYFSEAAAQDYAKKIRAKGFDVYVGGVDAYSTLGWFKDPVLNTFIEDSDRRLASLIFHELTHQRLFIPGDTEFNEALATAVAEEGLRRWLLEKNDPVALEKCAAELKHKKQFVDLIREARQKLDTIYERSPVTSQANLREQKEAILNQLHADYAELKKEWNGYSGYDDWFAGPLNNAQLNTVSTYYDLVPVFRKMIDDDGGDLNRFFEEAKKFARLSKEKRHLTLVELKLRQSQTVLAAPNSPKPTASLPL
jgi:predicted aminopeptidase